MLKTKMYLKYCGHWLVDYKKKKSNVTCSLSYHLYIADHSNRHEHFRGIYRLSRLQETHKSFTETLKKSELLKAVFTFISIVYISAAINYLQGSQPQQLYQKQYYIAFDDAFSLMLL